MLREGDTLLQSGNYAGAETAFTEVIDNEGTSSFQRRDALIRRAKARLQLDRAAEAAADADAALAIFADAEGHYLRGRALRRTGEMEKAEEAFRWVIDANERKQRRLQMQAGGPSPQTPPRTIPGVTEFAVESALALGEMALVEEQYQAAIDAFDTAAALAPDKAKVYLERGGAYRLMEMEERATEDLGRYRRLGGDPEVGPESVLAPLPLKAALAHYAAGEYPSAIAAATQALALQPGYVGALLCRGHSRIKLGQFDQALEDFNTVVQIAPENLEAHIYRAYALTELGQYDAAEKEAAFVLERQPDNIHALMQRGFAAMGKKHYTVAAEAFSRILEREPGQERARLYRGIARYQDGMLDEAEEDFATLIERTPDNVRAYYLLALCLHRQHDDQAAQAVVNRALALGDGTGSSELYHLRGNLHHNAGQLEEALADFDRALALDPGNAKLYMSRGVINSSLGRAEAAQADFALARTPPAPPGAPVPPAEENLQPEPLEPQ